MAGQYQIINAQLPLVSGLGGHNFVTLIDPNGNVIGEINGLATDSDGKVKPIGYLPTDTLKVYLTDSKYYYDTTRNQVTLYSPEFDS